MTKNIALSPAATAEYRNLQQVFILVCQATGVTVPADIGEEVLDTGHLQLIFEMPQEKFPIQMRLTIPPSDWRYQD